MSAPITPKLLTYSPQDDQPDSRFEILKDVMRMQSDYIINLCLSYIPLTTFSSIPKFLNYFKERDVLPLNAGQPLEIRDISVLIDLQTKDPDIYPKNIGLTKYRFVLNRILALVAKTGDFIAEKEGRVTFNAEISDRIFTIKFASDINLQTERGTITIRPKHLFYMMDKFDISSISFAANQALYFIGITPDEQQIEKGFPLNYKKWIWHVPEGCGINWAFNKNIATVGNGKLNNEYYGIDQSQLYFSIKAPDGMTLSLYRSLPVDSLALCNRSIVSTPIPLTELSVVRFTEETMLQKDFAYHDKNAIVIIDGNLIGLGRKVSIIARNVIISPKAKIEVEELNVVTTHSSILLNIKALNAYLITKTGSGIIGNSNLHGSYCSGFQDSLIFGVTLIEREISLKSRRINLLAQRDAILKVLQDALPLGSHLDVRRILPMQSELSTLLLEDPEAKKDFNPREERKGDKT